MMYVARIDHFSSAGMKWLFAENRTLAIIATYITLFYQGAFPILVWFKKVKLPLLLLGVLIHLSISFLMGIFAFGIIMSLSYILFLDERHINKLKGLFQRKTKIS
jgi:uncharacterized membrane protein (DUF485 family)